MQSTYTMVSLCQTTLIDVMPARTNMMPFKNMDRCLVQFQCPKCGKESLKRGIGGGSAVFQFQGSGFYETDYKKGGNSACCPAGKDKGSCKK